MFRRLLRHFQQELRRALKSTLLHLITGLKVHCTWVYNIICMYLNTSPWRGRNRCRSK